MYRAHDGKSNRIRLSDESFFPNIVELSSLGGSVSSLLPIFPLELVLLPGAALPLHIFEPRYKEMITECLAQKKPFGVVRASDEGVADIGCTAEIALLQDENEDEDEPAHPTAETITQAVRLQAEIAKLAGTEPVGLDEHAATLSFLLAGSLPLDLDFKQSLLSTLSEAKRLQAVVDYLEAILPGLRRAAKARWN